MILGDVIHEALDRAGLTSDRVKYWLGDCCCEERRQKLNQLHRWATRSFKETLELARTYFDSLTEGE